MKKSILTLAACVFLSGIVFTSCNSSAKKVDNAQQNVIEANKKLEDANKEYQADMENYRKETAMRIEANNQSIIEFNKRMEHDKKAARAENKKRIAMLEQKNKEMKQRMDNYNQEGKENWERFKMEFGHDMDELGNAFKDLTVKNVK